MNKIKICYVIVNCKITGPMNQTLNIIKNLDKSRFSVSFITLFDEEKNNSMIDEYLKVINEHYCLHLNKLSSIIYGKFVLKKVLKKIHPNIIQGLGMPPYRLSLHYKNARHIVTLRNYAYEDYPTYYNRIIGPILAYLDIKLIKKNFKKNATFVTCSKSLTKIYSEKENMNIPYIQNGVDIEKYPKKDYLKVDFLREKLNIPKNKIIGIYTAPFIGRKNQEFILKIFKEYSNKNVVLVLCGNGDDYEALYKKYANNPNIIFTGKVKNVSEYLRSSDFYISCSLSEGMPNSVLEAMSTGLPVLLSNIPQHKELFDISDNIGYLFDVKNEKDFINKLDRIVCSNLIKMGEESYNCILKNLTSKIMAKKYANLYDKMIKGSDENDI